jgi:DNA helicase HerA-like ATPase
VGVYFITQNPADVPENILGQLGNRVQHALRAFTAKDQKDLKMAAETYRPNPRFDTQEAIRDVGTGEAVTSFLENKGIPGIVERTLIRPPSSHLGPIDPALRAQLMVASPVAGKYDKVVDRESAYEMLRARADAAAQEAARQDSAAQPAPSPWDKGGARADDDADGYSRARRYDGNSEAETKPKPRSSSGRSDSVGEAFAKSFARQLGSRSGQALVRGILGSLFRSR